ncbi:MAG: 1-phosphofructokinase family hexose kinase [Acidobacteriota bacterium]
MILVASLNPAIDVRLEIERLQPGEVHRVGRQVAFAGGKGRHVAETASLLGAAVRMTGFLAGAEGEWFQRELEAGGIQSDFQFIKGRTRRCLALFEREGRVTEILEPGPEVKPSDLDLLHKKIVRSFEDSRIMVLSGSLPPGVPGDFYNRLIQEGHSRGIISLLDTSGIWLKKGLKGRPFAVKPNQEEFEELQTDSGDIASGLLELQRMGISLPILSVGSQGLFFCWEDKVGRVQPPQVEAVNAVGSGDCLMGGLAHALDKGEGPLEGLRQGAACGAANALTTETGFFRKDDYLTILSQVQLVWPFQSQASGLKPQASKGDQ